MDKVLGTIKISIIIPIYNTKEYFKKCLDSVVNQTLKEIQIICIDDGSTDGSYEILQQYANQFENILVLQQENKGAGVARNRGIRCAQGEYICFLDADDYYFDNRVLDRLYRAATVHKVHACGGNIVKLSDNVPGECIAPVFEKEEALRYNEFQDYYYYQRFIFSRQLLIDNQIEFPPYRRFQDPPFMMKAMLAAKQMYLLNEPVYVYRTGHKTVRTSLEVAREALLGVKECFWLAKENDLRQLYDLRLKNVLSMQFPYYAKFVYEHEESICELLDQINEINVQWLGEDAVELQTKERIWRELDEAKTIRAELLERCHAFEKVLVYGAGKIGNFFLENYANECENIIGIAVSDKEGNVDKINDYKVRVIGDYTSSKETALVIVAIGANGREDVANQLKELGFKNVICLDYKGLLLLERAGI